MHENVLTCCCLLNVTDEVFLFFDLLLCSCPVFSGVVLAGGGDEGVFSGPL